MTREDIKIAWDNVMAAGKADLGEGFLLQKGIYLNQDASEEENAEYDEDSVYLTTYDGLWPTPVIDFDDAVDELKDQIREIVLRYVVLDTRQHYQFEKILPEWATEEDGLEELDAEWSNLPDSEKKKASLELVRMACRIEDGDISTAVDEAEDRGYIESQGWDWWGSYTPIATRTAK